MESPGFRHTLLAKEFVTMRITIITLTAAAAILLAGCTETPEGHMGAAVDNDQNVLTGGPITGTTIEELPGTVKETLKERVPHAEIATIEKTRRDGQLVYAFNFVDTDTTPALYVRKDGTVVPPPPNTKK